jgi:hypothetical protein
VNEDQAPRQNRKGHPCPPWCQIDHDEVHGASHSYLFHGGPITRVEMRGKRAALPSDEIFARAFHAGDPDDKPVVAVSSYRIGAAGQDPGIWLGPADAGDLAGLVEMLASATPAQHRQLAAAIRQAAAEITEAGNG